MRSLIRNKAYAAFSGLTFVRSNGQSKATKKLPRVRNVIITGQAILKSDLFQVGLSQFTASVLLMTKRSRGLIHCIYVLLCDHINIGFAVDTAILAAKQA